MAAMFIVIVLRNRRNGQKQTRAYQADCLLHLEYKARFSIALLQHDRYCWLLAFGRDYASQRQRYKVSGNRIAANGL